MVETERVEQQATEEVAAAQILELDYLAALVLLGRDMQVAVEDLEAQTPRAVVVALLNLATQMEMDTEAMVLLIQ